MKAVSPGDCSALVKVLKRLLRSIRDAWKVKEDDPVLVAEREAAVAALNEQLNTDNPSTARFVLAEMKDSVEIKRAAQRTIEGKATSIIGFASAALVFATAFRNGALLMTGWVLPGLVLQSAAIVAGVAVLLLRGGALPNVLLYNRSDVVGEASNEARIASALAEQWGQYERKLNASGAVRAARLDVAFGTYILGLFWIVALSASSVPRHGNGAATRCFSIPNAVLDKRHFKERPDTHVSDPEPKPPQKPADTGDDRISAPTPQGKPFREGKKPPDTRDTKLRD